MINIFSRNTLFCASPKITETHPGFSFATQVKAPLNGPITRQAHLFTFINQMIDSYVKREKVSLAYCDESLAL